jgi:hypothetical protein
VTRHVTSEPIKVFVERIARATNVQVFVKQRFGVVSNFLHNVRTVFAHLRCQLRALNECVWVVLQSVCRWLIAKVKDSFHIA